MITRERPSLMHDKIKTHQALLAEILSAGNDTGEFKIDDVIETERAVYTALVVFDVSLFIGLFSRKEVRTARRKRRHHPHRGPEKALNGYESFVRHSLSSHYLSHG